MNVEDSIFGYRFSDAALLERALVTPSYKSSYPGTEDNQRLEFLGDAVLGLLAADRLYRDCEADREGTLTVKRTRMVSAAALCEAALRLNLVPRLKRNRGAPPLPANSKTIADAMEAIIGAAWLDGGMAAAVQVFDALGLSPDCEGRIDNPRGELQIRTQAMRPPQIPQYSVISVTGRSDSPEFTVRVSVDGIGMAEAKAHSRREAEAAAAEALLKEMGC